MALTDSWSQPHRPQQARAYTKSAAMGHVCMRKPNSQQNGALTPNRIEELIQRFYYGLKISGKVVGKVRTDGFK